MADIFNDEVVDAWAAAAAADAEFQLLSRGAELPLELFCDDDSRRLQIRLGEINARPAAEDSPLILAAPPFAGHGFSSRSLLGSTRT